MLKDIFKKPKKSKKSKEDTFGLNFKGELEIIAKRDGKIIHHDKGNNIVTNWARHANMKLIAAALYSKIGNGDPAGDIDQYITSKRSIAEEDHVEGSYNGGIYTTGKNEDGTLISGEQYFSNNTGYYEGDEHRYYSNVNADSAIITPGNKIFPIFPTKMLFGTGVEYEKWEDISTEDRAEYEDSLNGGWNATNFDANINEDLNWYSGDIDPSTGIPKKTKTMNDLKSSELPAFTDYDIPAIKGAIKNSLITDTVSANDNTEPNTEDQLFPINNYKGIGLPSFIYCLRDDGTISFETNDGDDLVTKLTFQVVMPAQDDGNDDKLFYPYNGYLLKVAGLFCDARFSLSTGYATGEVRPNEAELTPEGINYNSMPGGMLWAARPITPVFKDHRTEITARWTIYITKED